MRIFRRPLKFCLDNKLNKCVFKLHSFASRAVNKVLSNKIKFLSIYSAECILAELVCNDK